MPPGSKNVPSYWITLTTKVPEQQGLPHFSDVHIWNIKATGATQAFAVRAYPNATLDNFRLDHLDIEAKTAGFIANAKNWTFSGNEIKTADGSKVTVTDLPEPHGKDAPYGEPQ
jgi:hypothetical protein